MGVMNRMNEKPKFLGIVWGVLGLLVVSFAVRWWYLESKPESPLLLGPYPAFGSSAHIALYDATAEKQEQAAHGVLVECIGSINAALSVFEPESDVSQIHRKAGTGEWVEAGEDFMRVYQASLQLNRESGGAFHPAMGAVMEAWGFFRGGEHHAFPPEEETVSIALSNCDLCAIDFRKETRRVRIQNAKTRLDFGAIAKGYGVDCLYERLLTIGCTNFIVEIGGNIRCAGNRSNGSYRVGVRDPRQQLGGGILGVLAVPNGWAVATSGNYEQFFLHEGRRYTHIMNPLTGWPVEALAQVSVIATEAMIADGLSTTCFVLGPEESEKMMAQYYPGCGAYFVWVDETNGTIRTVAVGDWEQYFETLESTCRTSEKGR